MKAAVAKPAPEYTSIARQMKVAGHVEIEAVISSDGSVEDATAVTGNPLLTQSAVNAVKNGSSHLQGEWRTDQSRRHARLRFQAIVLE